MNKAKLQPFNPNNYKLLYYGETQERSGFGFSEAKGNRWERISVDWTEFTFTRFNPYDYADTNGVMEGTVTFLNTKIYTIYAIAGSPYDARGNTVCCFFVQGQLTKQEILHVIFNNNASRKIIMDLKFVIGDGVITEMKFPDGLDVKNDGLASCEKQLKKALLGSIKRHTELLMCLEKGCSDHELNLAKDNVTEWHDFTLKKISEWSENR